MANVEKDSVLQALIVEVERVLTSGNSTPVIIAIDGNCGSGKTFYATQLAKRFQANLVHCDDFFLPNELRTAERLQEIGGNVHYERLRETLSALKNEQVPNGGKVATIPFTYMAYNCSTGAFQEITQTASNVVIVEGSYALHPSLTELYDLKILLTVDAQTQYGRLLKREGEQGITNFVNKWIPLENRYFASLDTSDCVVIDTSQVMQVKI